MNRYGIKLLAGIILSSAAAFALGQSTPKPAYLNPSLPAAERAADLVHRMTLEEKASQMVNQARAIPRLGVPAYDWWSEALHGVAVAGTTEFPEPIALGATFDAPGIYQMATDIGVEGRVVHAEDVKANHGASTIFHGLDFWAPNINIVRDPRWGRGQETYGEDPFLTAHMAVAYVTGMQGNNPRYYRAIATPKHFALYSGPEPLRHEINVVVSKHDEFDTYLPAFRAALTQGKADSTMCSYSSVNGQPACANQFLLGNVLRDDWRFQGYVVSDCGAVRDIYDPRHVEPTIEQADALAVTRGVDNECIDFRTKMTNDSDYLPYIKAVKDGYLKESDLDQALIRTFTARIKLGMFDPPSMVPYTRINPNQLNSPAHRALALKLANESMVLLKNDGTLPLKTKGSKILVVGPLASQTRVLLGNYTGIPTHTVSILEGMKKEFADSSITYMEGTGFLSKQVSPVPGSLLTTNGKPGVTATYLKQEIGGLSETEGAAPPAASVLATRVEPGIDLGLPGAAALPASVANVHPLTVRWQTTLTPAETGNYELGVKTGGFFVMTVDHRFFLVANYPHGVESTTRRVHLVAGHPYHLFVEYSRTPKTEPYMVLVWHKDDNNVDPNVLTAAKKADVVIAVVGITSELEGEQMPVDQPGFKGGDRTSLALPAPEKKLLQALATAGKPLVVVLTNGSALAVNWASANPHVDAILDAWYPGEEGGEAVAQTLSGKNDPGGRLPITFYTGVDQLPPFTDYSMKNRTYRYFTGKPLYPFGYGLSYTTFSYSGLTLPEKPIKAGDPLTAEVTVTNTGKRAGDEVAQLYLNFPPVAGAPLKALRGFERLHLAPGASQNVTFKLDPRDMSMVTEAGQPVVAAGEYTVSVGGGQPGTGVPVLTGHFKVKGTLKLPE